MPTSRRRVRKPARAPSALWRTQQALLDTWLQDSLQGQQLLRERTLEEARETVRELLAQGLLEMQVIDLPGEHMRIEIWPTALALAGEADAPQASQAVSAR
jgi:hypothetical protein